MFGNQMSERRSAADHGEYRQAAGTIAEGRLILISLKAAFDRWG